MLPEVLLGSFEGFTVIDIMFYQHKDCIMALPILHIRDCGLNTLCGVCVTLDAHFWQVHASICVFYNLLD